MKLLDIAPGPMVGKAYNYLLSLRLDQGPMGDERAEEELKKWWAQQQG